MIHTAIHIIPNIDYRRLFFIASVLFLLSIHISAQNQGNIWYFGNNAGVDFNSGNPAALANGQISFAGNGYNEGSSAISDNLGSLLFYSDGTTVWNKNHTVMLNGSGILGNFSSTQSCIIVPQPLSSRFFYLFTVSSGFSGGSIADGFRYSKIDMCADNGLGEVLLTEKNIKLVDSVAEKISVTRHSNGVDYWILIHKFFSNQFYALQLTPGGITNTIISSVGSVHNGNIAGSIGQMKFSSNGQKLAVAAGNGLDLLEIFDFNTSTGIVSNAQTLSRLYNGSPYGVEFSPNGNNLYVTTFSFFPTFGTYLTQYNLNAGSITAINASMNQIGGSSNIVEPKGLQIGPDGKIYMVSIGNAAMLSVISNPNVYGAGCTYQNQSISLGAAQGSYTLPGFIANYDYSNQQIVSVNVTGNSSVNLSCNPNTVVITANSSTQGVSYSWTGPGVVSGGNTNAATVNAAGTYTVTVINTSGCTKTATVVVTNNNPLPNVTAGNSLTLNCTQNQGAISASSTTLNVNYLWAGPGIVSGGNTNSPVVNVIGTYTVTVTDLITGCTNTATVQVNGSAGVVAAISANITIQSGQSTVLNASGGNVYNWYPSTALNNTTSSSVIASPVQTTTYCVEVSDGNGCKDTACVTIYVETPCIVNSDFTVPSAFSPNDDGINDLFCLQGWNTCIDDFSVKILNRWGEEIFFSKNPDFCWDGKFQNKIMDVQVFVYYIKAKYNNSNESILKTGNISLLR